MNVAANAQQLGSFLQEAADVAEDKPVVVTKFILNAKEVCGRNILCAPTDRRTLPTSHTPYPHTPP